MCCDLCEWPEQSPVAHSGQGTQSVRALSAVTVTVTQTVEIAALELEGDSQSSESNIQPHRTCGLLLREDISYVSLYFFPKLTLILYFSSMFLLRSHCLVHTEDCISVFSCINSNIAMHAIKIMFPNMESQTQPSVELT